jgi:hypothetical protein
VQRSFPRPSMAVETSPDPWREARGSVRALGELLERQQGLADGLVLLQEFPLPRLAEGVREVEESLAQLHPRAVDPLLAEWAAAPVTGAVPPERLRFEHRTFCASAKQLRWFYEIVEREDQGGHRQALGQYWKLLLEALRHHLRDERQYLERAPSGETANLTTPSGSRPGALS